MNDEKIDALIALLADVAHQVQVAHDSALAASDSIKDTGE